MAFSDIKGQQRIAEFFRNSVNRKKVAHTYLFLGPQGLGKTMVAKDLAKFLNCEEPVKKGNWLMDCCDRCTSCRKIESFNHPDVHWIEPGPSFKISIENIRLIQREISLTTYEGRFKVFVILQAHAVTEEAANSLLKTLEEPPSFSVIILTSDNISGLLPTITSRCQIIKFYPLNTEKIKDILTHEFRLSDNEVHFLSSQAEGRIGQALHLRDKDILRKKNRIIDLVQTENRDTLYIEAFNIKDKKELFLQIKYLLNWFRDILIFKLRPSLSQPDLINSDRMKEIAFYAERYRLHNLEQIITQIMQTHRLIKQNINPKIALAVMLERIAICSSK